MICRFLNISSYFNRTETNYFTLTTVSLIKSHIYRIECLYLLLFPNETRQITLQININNNEHKRNLSIALYYCFMSSVRFVCKRGLTENCLIEIGSFYNLKEKKKHIDGFLLS